LPPSDNLLQAIQYLPQLPVLKPDRRGIHADVLPDLREAIKDLSLAVRRPRRSL